MGPGQREREREKERVDNKKEGERSRRGVCKNGSREWRK